MSGTKAARSVSAAEAVKHIRPDDAVVLGMREPARLVEALVARRAELRGLRLIVGSTMGGQFYTDADSVADFDIAATFVGPSLRAASRARQMSYIPIHISQIGRAAAAGDLRTDVLLVQVAPADDNGYCSLSVSVDWSFDLASVARLVIAEVNDQMPRMPGKNGIHLSAIDYIVPTSYPPQAWPAPNIGEIERTIGQHVAELVPDGACLEIGFGSTAEAVLEALRDRRDLGIHTGSITQGVRTLVEAGAVTGARKSIDRGLIIGATARGSADFYDWVATHPDIRLRPFSYTHDVRTISQIDGFVALNTALQIDLTGQLNAEYIGGATIGGVGGQVDWIRGAHYSAGGLSIHALSARAGGKHSAIVAELAPGAPVTTSRADVQWVVTEYGAVNLRGRSLRERARALAGIAHPDFRADLVKVAEAL